VDDYSECLPFFVLFKKMIYHMQAFLEGAGVRENVIERLAIYICEPYLFLSFLVKWKKKPKLLSVLK